MTSRDELVQASRDEEHDALVARLRRYVRTAGRRFLDDPNITSVGIGYKIKDGKRTDQICLQFTVGTKLEGDVGPESLDTRMIPETIPVAGEDIPTDVVERRFEPSFRAVSEEETNPRKRRLDTLVPGVSVSHPSGTAGTLGLIVFDRTTGQPCMLSNWHVLHRADGDIGDGVVQPGPHDDNAVGENHAGTLLRSHLGPAGDCAIARIEGRDFRPEILDLDVQPTQLARVDLGDLVVKSGRTTSVTHGVVRRIDVMAKIRYDGVGVKEIGGFEIGPPDDAGADFEVSMGGDSGSVWLIAKEDRTASNVMVGLHFAGEGRNNPDEHALACNAHAVFKKLNIALVEPQLTAVPTIGYKSRFLSSEVPMPKLSEDLLADTFLLDGSELLHYTHFSLSMSKSRALARFVAWNIDGGRLRRLPRRGFMRDKRVPLAGQHGNELYRHNPLDRGHIARRADLAWGTKIEADRANRESFFYTNIAPQHSRFNQSSRGGLWGELENALFDDVDLENLRVSVMGGPIFGQDDPVHRGVLIPRDYWKLLAYVDAAAGNALRVSAFVLTQKDLLTDLEILDLEPFRIFQVPLDELEQITGLGFDALHESDTFSSDIEVEGMIETSIVEVTQIPRAREIVSRDRLFMRTAAP